MSHQATLNSYFHVRKQRPADQQPSKRRKVILDTFDKAETADQPVKKGATSTDTTTTLLKVLL